MMRPTCSRASRQRRSSAATWAWLLLFPWATRADALNGFGTPIQDYATTTITISMAFTPTLAPGDSSYRLLGCYGRARGEPPSLNGDDNEYDTPRSVDAQNLTIPACLQGCAALGVSKGVYPYASMTAGSKCYCSNDVPLNTIKLAADNCTSPCTGHHQDSCGGKDSYAVYSSLSSPPQSASDNLARDGTPTFRKKLETSPTTAVASPNAPDTDPKSAVVPPMIIWIGMASAVVIGFVVLFFSLRRQNKKEAGDGKRRRKARRPGLRTDAHTHNGVDLSLGRDVVPSTPALESGGHGHGGQDDISSPKGGARNSRLFSRLMGEVSTPSASASAHRGHVRGQSSSSGIQRATYDDPRTDQQTERPARPPDVHHAPAAGPQPWHRRRMSALLPPPGAPPAAPPPPTPPSKSTVPQRPSTGRGLKTVPEEPEARQPRSAASGQSKAPGQDTRKPITPPAPLNLVRKKSTGSIRGLTSPFCPSVGATAGTKRSPTRFQGLSAWERIGARRNSWSSTHTRQDTLPESPVVGRMPPPAREPSLPILPPIAYGETFDLRWEKSGQAQDGGRGTSGGHDGDEVGTAAREGFGLAGDKKSPASTTDSITTSMLFPDDDEGLAEEEERERRFGLAK